MLNSLGVKVYDMSGALAAWKYNGYELDTEPETLVIPKSVENFEDSTIANPDEILWMDTINKILAKEILGQVADNRSKKEWDGEYSGYDYHDLAGKIEGSVWCPQGSEEEGQYFDNVDNTPRTKDELIYHMKEYGVDTSQTVAFGATLGVIHRVGSIGGNIAGGYLTDKIGTGKLMFTAYGIIFGLQIILILIPINPKFIFLVAMLYVLILLFFNMNYAMSWTMIGQSDISIEYSGTVAGLISTFGAIPETLVFISAGKIIDNYPGLSGYRYIFYILTIIIGIECILIYIWVKYLKNKNSRKMDEYTKEDIKVCMH